MYKGYPNIVKYPDVQKKDIFICPEETVYYSLARKIWREDYAGNYQDKETLGQAWNRLI